MHKIIFLLHVIYRPLGLVLLGINGIIYGNGWYIRRYLVCGILLLHGGRMFFGAAVLFFPYNFKGGLFCTLKFHC